MIEQAISKSRLTGRGRATFTGGMRAWPWLLTCLAVAGGCARTQPGLGETPGSAGAATAGAPVHQAAPAERGERPALIVTPEAALIGKVAWVNRSARFVVLNFPVGRLPALEQVLQVYRHGLKVGEVKVSGPHLDDNIVADLAVGEAEVGDEVRDR